MVSVVEPVSAPDAALFVKLVVVTRGVVKESVPTPAELVRLADVVSASEAVRAPAAEEFVKDASVPSYWALERLKISTCWFGIASPTVCWRYPSCQFER